MKVARTKGNNVKDLYTKTDTLYRVTIHCTLYTVTKDRIFLKLAIFYREPDENETVM